MKLFNKINGVVDTMCSATFQGIVTVAWFFVAPVSTAIEEIVMRTIGNDLLGRGVNALAGYLANEPLDVSKFAGGEMGSLIDAGNFLAANEIAKSNGGRPLSKSETSLIIEKQNSYIAQDYKNKSIYDKYFNIMDANTPVAGFIAKQSPDVGENLAMVPSKLISLTGSIIKNVSSIGSAKSYAATNYYDYGLPRIGFSDDEINNQKLKNPIENADKAAELIKGPNGDDYKNFFRKCYGLEIADDLSSQPIANASIIYQGKKGILEMKASIAGNEIKCSEPKSEELLRIRMAVFDTQRMEGLACYEGDEEACRNITGMDTYTQSNDGRSTKLAVDKASNNVKKNETRSFLLIKNNGLLQSIYRNIYTSSISRSYSLKLTDNTTYAYGFIKNYV